MGRSGARYAQLGAGNVFTVIQTFNASARINGLMLNQVAKTGAYAVFSTDVVVLADATAGAFAVTINPTLGQFRVWVVKKVDASANAVTITPASGTIDGAASFALAAQNNSAIVISDGVNLFILGKV